MADIKKSRKSNFSQDEVDVLVSSIQTHFNALYGKDAKLYTNRDERQKAWLDILKKVNKVSVEKRTLQEVKNKWKKCQYAIKEKNMITNVSEILEILKNENLSDELGRSTLTSKDSMPLQERLEKTPQEKPSQTLKSQTLSPTKLKVTRQSRPPPPPPPPLQKPIVERPPSPVNEEMCLRWNSHHSNMQTAFPSILSKEQYVDVTLAAEGKTLKCHRLILSSCSPYFDEILSGISPLQHPVLFMKDIPFWILKSLCDFMYSGEVHIFQDKLEELLMVAEALRIKGLAGKTTQQSNDQKDNNNKSNKPQPSPQQHQQQTKQHQLPPPHEDHDYDNDETLDPLDLLEPLYEEEDKPKQPSMKISTNSTIIKEITQQQQQKHQPTIKKITKKIRKRKSESREPSPPQIFSFRKGTRSRPNVKIPKYYHSDYASSSSSEISRHEPATTITTKPQQITPPSDLLSDVEIKTEPIDVEDNVVDYNEDNDYQNGTTTTTIMEEGKLKAFKKIKLSKPIISDVHTITEPAEIFPATTITAICEEKNKEIDDDDEEIKENGNDELLPSVAIITVREEDATDDHQADMTSSSLVETSDDNEAAMTSLQRLEKEAMNVANSINK